MKTNKEGLAMGKGSRNDCLEGPLLVNPVVIWLANWRTLRCLIGQFPYDGDEMRLI